jgi:hypothetical protein
MECARIITLITLDHPLFSPSTILRRCNHSGTSQKQILFSIDDSETLVNFPASPSIDFPPSCYMRAPARVSTSTLPDKTHTFPWRDCTASERRLCQWTPTWHNCRYRPIQSTPLVPLTGVFHSVCTQGCWNTRYVGICNRYET